MWKANQESITKESVGSQLPKIQEGGNGSDFGAAISGNFGNVGNPSSLLGQKEANIGREMLENVEPGGEKRSSLKISKG